MNSDIDEIIDSLNETTKELNTVSSKDLIEKKQEIDASDTDELSNTLVNMVFDDRKKSDEIFDLFYTNLASDNDRTTASKEALARALELKIEASKNIIELLKIKTKADEQGAKVGIFFGGVSPKKAGLDINEIRNAASQTDNNKI